MSCSKKEGISIENAWIPEAPPTVQALAGYMEIENHFPHEIILIAANSPFFEYIELHRSMTESDTNMFRMVKQKQVKILSGQNLTLLSGGYHLMLINPRQNLTVDQSVPINLIFNDGQEIEVNFKVRKQQLKLEEGGWF